MVKHTHAKYDRENGRLSVRQHETDSPLLPIEHLEKLHAFRPDLVDWIINQTTAEADSRRKERKRINLFIFCEHLIGQLSAFLIGLAGISGGIYAAVNGQAWVGGVIATASISGLAVVFLTGRNPKSKSTK